jgi:hypothetical protein
MPTTLTQPWYLAVGSVTLTAREHGSTVIERCCEWPLTIGSSDRGARPRLAQEGIDDLDDRDKAASIDGSAGPRRSTSTLDTL